MTVRQKKIVDILAHIVRIQPTRLHNFLRILARKIGQFTSSCTSSSLGSKVVYGGSLNSITVKIFEISII